MRRLTPLGAEIVRETVPKEPCRRRQGEVIRSLRPDEEYARNSLISTGELITICEQMGYAVEFLSGYRTRKTVSGELITRLDYIVYHLENHLIRTGSVMDRSLHLVNVIFRLGIPGRECRFATIAENEHVVRSPVADALRAVEKILKPYRSQRNLVVHRQRHSEKSLERLEVYYVLQKSETNELESDVTDGFSYVYKQLTDKFITTKKKELSKFNIEVYSAISNLFSALEPVFDSHYEAIRRSG